MVKDLLICFFVQTKKLKFFEAKLKNENIEIIINERKRFGK